MIQGKSRENIFSPEQTIKNQDPSCVLYLTFYIYLTSLCSIKMLITKKKKTGHTGKTGTGQVATLDTAA